MGLLGLNQLTIISRTSPNNFGVNVSKFRKDSDSPAQFQVDDIRITSPNETANALSKHLQSLYSNTASVVLKFSFSLCSDRLLTASVNDDDICKALK
jgi:hypothetical protein